MNRFRVVQFNMQFGQIWDDTWPDRAPIRIESTIGEIRRHDADVIMLQEVERALPDGVQRQPPPNYTRMKEALAEYDSWFSYPKPDPRELPFGIGLAIFSRTPLRDRMRLDLQSPSIEFDFLGERKTPTDRVLIGARTALGGLEIRLLNTHLLAFFMLGRTSDQYPAQRNAIAALLKAADGPLILTGDFNVSRHKGLVEQFGRCGFATVQQDKVTWRRRPYILDHIFYNQPLRCVAHSVVPTAASDHHVLVADFEL